MNHTPAHLILAAHVRELAHRVRHERLETALADWESRAGPLPVKPVFPSTPQELLEFSRAEKAESDFKKARSAFRTQWLDSHSALSFSRDALALLVQVADEIAPC